MLLNHTYTYNGQDQVSFDNIDYVMASPTINVPVYKEFYDIAPDFFAPNLSDILRNNKVGVFNINQKAVEALMVGLNFELSREFLWRGYPTDQRGTTFKGFWKNLGENNWDINPIHEWNTGSTLTSLGQNHPVNLGSPVTEYLVFAVRADLFRKFPRPLVMLRKAVDSEGTPVVPEPSNNAGDSILPEFYAFINEDMLFVGFPNISKEMVIGDGETDMGYYFVISESPAGVRFGLDGYKQELLLEDLAFWSDLQWGDIDSSGNALFVNSASSVRNVLDYDDSFIVWGKSSADLASILYRPQAKLAIHGKVLFN